jgi:hypothetical protein
MGFLRNFPLGEARVKSQSRRKTSAEPFLGNFEFPQVLSKSANINLKQIREKFSAQL